MSQLLDIARVRERLLGVAQRLSFLGPTLARLTVGLVFIGTGWGKLHSMPDVIENFRGWGIPFPGFNAHLAAATEFFGRLLVLAGPAPRLAAPPMAFTMG